MNCSSAKLELITSGVSISTQGYYTPHSASLMRESFRSDVNGTKTEGHVRQREDIQSDSRGATTGYGYGGGGKRSRARSVLSVMHYPDAWKRRFLYLRFVVGRNKMPTCSMGGHLIGICRSEPEEVLVLCYVLKFCSL